MTTPLWIPNDPAATRMAAFGRRVGHDPTGPGGYQALWRWSIEDRPGFWAAVLAELDLTLHSPPTAPVLDADAMPGARWFPGATLNFAENLLGLRDGSCRYALDAPAVICQDESGRPARAVTRGELIAHVARVQAFLVAQGVGPGDRVAGWLPNGLAALVAMLATTATGAVWSSSSPDFGTDGVLARFGQIRPTVLLVGDRSRYGGKVHDMLERAGRIAAALAPELRRVVVVPLDGDPDAAALARHLPDAATWAQVLATPAPAAPSFAALPFDHPVYILYSSGTTGAPKCITHGAGGTLLQHGKELALHTDLGPGDVLFYYTTTGWMMWNWLVSGLLVGATIVVWDGSPVHPTPDALWRLAAEHGVTAFGTSPRFLAMCAEGGQEPGVEHDLSRLRVLLSTGSPLSEELFRWTYAHVKADLQLASICGGTDIVSCFMLGSPVSPVYAGEIQAPGLGMAIAALGPDGEPVVGARGELVCTRPFPSMPVGFWGDADGSRYHKAYFAHFPGIWRHGDFITLTERGGVIVHGRSDATLNPGGVRIGSAEIYAPVEALPEVSDSVVVALPDGDDVRIVLFIVPAPGVTLDDALRQRIKGAVRAAASPRHVPALVLAAPDLPRTLSGKKVEIAVQQVLQGQPAPNRDALANPSALDWFATEGRAALESV